MAGIDCIHIIEVGGGETDAGRNQIEALITAPWKTLKKNKNLNISNQRKARNPNKTKDRSRIGDGVCTHNFPKFLTGMAFYKEILKTLTLSSCWPEMCNFCSAILSTNPNSIHPFWMDLVIHLQHSLLRWHSQWFSMMAVQ